MRPLASPVPVDLALGLGVAAWWLADAGDLPPAGVASLVLMTVPLGWRRTAPLAVAVLAAAGFAATGLQDEPPEPLAQLVATLVVTWSVAVHSVSWERAAAGLAISLAGGAGEALLLGEDLLFIELLIATAWAAGAAVRRLRGRETALEQRAAVLDEQARTAAADERGRIARELHDVVAHSVSVMVVQAGAAEQVLRTDPDQAERAMRAVQASGRAAVDDLRRMLGLLRGTADGAAGRRPQPGLADVAALTDAQEPPAEIRGAVPAALPAGVDLAAYRIVQEALTNARRHAAGRPTTVTIGWAGEALELEIRTRGPLPAGREQPGSGHGLIGMRERVAVYGGTLKAGVVEEDWVVHATLPAGGS